MNTRLRNLSPVRGAICLVLAACFPSLEAASLPDVMARVVREHPDVVAAEASLRAADAAIGQVRSDFYPTLSGSYSAASTTQTQAGISQTGTPRFGEGVLRWNLFRGQRDTYSLSSASHQRDAAAAEFNDAQERVALQVAEVYADVARLRRALVAAQAYVEEYQSLEKLVKSRVDNGRSSSADFTQIRVSLIEARVQVSTIQGQLRAAEHRYLTVVSVEPGAVVAPGLRWHERPLEAQVDTIEEGNPRVRASRERAAARTEEIGVARSTLYPSVDLELRKRFAQQNTLRSTVELDRSSQIGVGLEIPLGGRNFARIKEARAREQQALAQIESDKLAVRSSYGEIARQLVEVRTIAPHIQQRVEASAELVRAYGLQFEAGRRSVVELVTAQRERYSAQLALLDNVSQQFTLQARLLNLAGTLNADLQKTYYDAPVPLAMSAPSTLFQPGKATADVGLVKPTPAQGAEGSDSKASGAPAAVAVDATSAKPVAYSSNDEVRNLVQGWLKAWSGKDFARYRGYYAEFFRGEGFRNTNDWEAARRLRLGKPGDIAITLDALNARALSETEIAVDFVQRYQSADYSDVTKKQLLWRRSEGSWKIVRELTVTP